MVFGNKGEQSGTGVAFTRDPSTGEPGLFGEFLADAQGEDVVAGIRTPEPLEAMKGRLPDAFAEFVETVQRLEAHYRDMQDIEFTVEDGKLFLLQTRSAKRTAAAALKAAVDMVEEGLISREEAVARIDPGQLDQLLHPRIDPDCGLRRRGEGPERLARRRLGCGRLRRRHGRAAGQGGRGRHPRPLGDDARRHPRDDRRAGDPHRPRRDDVPCGGGRSGHGQAVRGGLRGALAGHGCEDHVPERHDPEGR